MTKSYGTWRKLRWSWIYDLLTSLK